MYISLYIYSKTKNSTYIRLVKSNLSIKFNLNNNVIVNVSFK